MFTLLLNIFVYFLSNSSQKLKTSVFSLIEYIKYNKFIEIDPYLSKKEPISIKGKEYESITQASKDLDKPNDYITWRLNSKSYPDWIYLKKEVELKETGEPKKKRVSILGNEYDSIAEAVKNSGIDRQIMRYRLKSKNYPDYFYI